MNCRYPERRQRRIVITATGWPFGILLLALVALVPVTVIPAPTHARAAGANVSINNFAFQPATLTITAGTTVTWTNQDDVGHTSTSDSGLWDSNTINPGSSYSHTFGDPGTYRYHCSIHSFMVGTIVVTSASGPTPGPSPTIPKAPTEVPTVSPTRALPPTPSPTSHPPSPELFTISGTGNARLLRITGKPSFARVRHGSVTHKWSAKFTLSIHTLASDTRRGTLTLRLSPRHGVANMMTDWRGAVTEHAHAITVTLTAAGKRPLKLSMRPHGSAERVSLWIILSAHAGFALSSPAGRLR